MVMKINGLEMASLVKDRLIILVICFDFKNLGQPKHLVLSSNILFFYDLLLGPTS